MSFCNVLKSSASSEAERNASARTHSHSSSLQMLLSTVKHSWCWHVTHMFYTLIPACFPYECYCQCAFDFIVHSGPEGEPLYLLLTPWHWREISVLELCGYLFLPYPHTVYASFIPLLLRILEASFPFSFSLCQNIWLYFFLWWIFLSFFFLLSKA